MFLPPPTASNAGKKKTEFGFPMPLPKGNLSYSVPASGILLFFFWAKGGGGKFDQKKGENTWQLSISFSRTRSNRGAAAACRRQECSLIALKAILVSQDRGAAAACRREG